jgi:hypothetical protein
LLPPLWCAGRLGNCPKSVKSFRIVTCLICRWRRRFYGKFHDPPFWIEYTYKSYWREEFVFRLVLGGLEFTRSDGGLLKHIVPRHVFIDPRGSFTSLRYAAIIVLDNLMKAFNVKKPLVEFCEFLANYPTW